MGLESSWLGGGGSSAAKRGESPSYASAGLWPGGGAAHPQSGGHAVSLEAAGASRHLGCRSLVGLHGSGDDLAGLGPVQGKTQHVHGQLVPDKVGGRHWALSNAAN